MAREKLDNAMKERKTYEKLKEKAFEEFKEHWISTKDYIVSNVFIHMHCIGLRRTVQK